MIFKTTDVSLSNSTLATWITALLQLVETTAIVVIEAIPKIGTNNNVNNLDFLINYLY